MEKRKVQYRFYEEEQIKPVYARLNDKESFKTYAGLRKKLVEYNLNIPIRAFHGASVLEFGPSTGDNSLIFAHWGAELTLVEPVEAFIENIDDYFKKNGLTGALSRVECNTFEKYETQDKFDFVVAEGFVFHTGLPDYWLPRLGSFIKKNGFLLFSHLETTGYLIELLHAKCLQYFQINHHEDPLVLSRKMFLKKWRKVNHSRNFDAWAYDNLIYPTLNAYLLNSIVDFQDIMGESGLLLWSSWPSVTHYRDVSWIKKQAIDKGEVIARNRNNFFRLLPSMVIGRQIDVTDQIDKVAESLFSALCSEVEALAIPIPSLDSKKINEIRQGHKKIDELFQVCVRDYNASCLMKLWQEIDQCLEYLANGDMDGIIHLFNSNGPLANDWGSPNFYSVWHSA